MATLIVDGNAARLQSRKSEMIEELAEVSVASNEAEGTIQEVPHYSVIQENAHEVG